MIVSGSINYTYTGRKRNTRKVNKVTKTKRPFKEMKEPLFTNSRIDEVNKYPSAPMTPYRPVKDTSYRRQHKFTVAPAYNKGAYMVIPRSEVEDIGR